MLVFAAVAFAAQVDKDGDVLLTTPNEALAPKAAFTDGFTIGTRATSEIMRDMWVGSDFDQDGNKEVLLASYSTSGRAYVYEITADNTAELFFDTGEMGGGYTSSTRHVAYGDLDGNGMQELLVSVNAAGAAGGIYVYEYDTVGDSMRTSVQILSDLAVADRWYVENFFVDDVDGDGVQEIMFGNNASSSTLDNFYIASVDSGDFASGKVRTKIEFTHGKSSVTYTLGGSPYGAVTSDMDGDGNKEVLFAGWDHGAMLIVEADSADAYTVLNYIQTDLDRRDDFAFYDFAPADLDGDGRDEVYLSMYDGGALYCITCPVGTELSAMTTANVHKIDVLGSSGGVCTQLGDFDGNGRMNIYASNGGSTITVHEYIGGDPTDAANWTKLSSLTNSDFSGIYGMRYAGDFDGDGYDEIYAANTGTASTAMAVAIEMNYEYLDLELTFDDASDVTNWSHWDEANGYTVEAWGADSTLVLSDGGYGFIAKRPVVATPGWIYKLSIDIKTSLWEGAGNTLELSVQGLGNDGVVTSCISDGAWTTFTMMGVAESDSGYIRIGGYKAGTVDTVFVDNVIWDEGYLDIYPSADIAAARKVVIGDTLAAIGFVTTTTNYGSSGPVYIQDETAGIAVYNYAAAQNVELGDEILVIGKMKNYNGLLEFDPVFDYMVLSKGNIVEPTVITALDMADRETYEGQLVTIEGFDTLDTGLSWCVTASSNKGFTLKDKNDSTFYCYIDKDTDIDGSPKPTQWPVDITGIVGDYNGAQLLPRSLADFKSSNKDPGAFTIVSPADSAVIVSFEDPNLDKVLVGADSVWALCMKWTKSVDPDTDVVTYQVMISPEGPEEDLITLDTVIYIPIENERPWDMNGSYNAYVVATDSLDGVTNSDTITITFDFPAPPEVIFADVVLVDGAPKLYAQFNMPFEEVAVANFTILDQSAVTATAPTTVDSLAPNAVMISGDLIEDHYIALVYSGIVTPGGDISVVDTAYAGEVLIPFSENNPEDAAKVLETFESNTGTFWAPTGSGSTWGVLTTSTFAVSDEEAYRGAKSGKLTLLDDPDKTGGYCRLYHQLKKSVSTTSKLMFLVKGTNADVEMRLSVKDTGYEQGPWTRVSLSEDDWQVVSFDLLNDEAEGWVNGNGIVEGTTVLFEAIHMRWSEDTDIVLYIDDITQRPNSNSAPAPFTMLKPTDGYEITNADVVQDSLIEVKWTKAVDPDGDAVSYEFFVIDAVADTVEFTVELPDTSGLIDAPTYEDNGNYKIYVLAYDTWGIFSSSDTINITINMLSDAIDGEIGLPKTFALHQNYPNPFNPITTIKYDLPKEAHVKILIYDIMGREVRALVNARQQAGYQTIQWNAQDNSGRNVSSGYYIYVMQADNFHKTQKMILLK